MHIGVIILLLLFGQNGQKFQTPSMSWWEDAILSSYPR